MSGSANPSAPPASQALGRRGERARLLADQAPKAAEALRFAASLYAAQAGAADAIEATHAKHPLSGRLAEDSGRIEGEAREILRCVSETGPAPLADAARSRILDSSADTATRLLVRQPSQPSKDEREAKFLRLGQLQDALLRNARFIVGIEMHTGTMTFDQAVDFYQKEGYQSKETAFVEARRSTSDPTNLYYTLGKLEIMKLRDDLKKKQGANFSLEEFHNNFLRQGFPPIKIVREALLGDDSPAL